VISTLGSAIILAVSSERTIVRASRAAARQLRSRCGIGTARLTASLLLALASSYLPAQAQQQTLTGRLVRAMAIGGESTGWALELDEATNIDGKQANSIQVSYRKTGKLEKLENKRVTATGKITHRQGVETGEQPVLSVSRLKEAKAAP